MTNFRTEFTNTMKHFTRFTSLAAMLSAAALFVAPTVASAQQCGATDDLHSGFFGLSGQDGIFFDIQATTPVTIECFEGYFTTGGMNITKMYIWYRMGSRVGVETDPTQWILIDSILSFNVGPTQATLLLLPINVDVSIPAGGTAGFYITNGDGPGQNNTGIRYDPGGQSGGVTASDVNISIMDGAGSYERWVIFSGTRQFAGRVNYTSLSNGIVGTLGAERSFLFPNPANNTLNVDLGNSGRSVGWSIIDAIGRTIDSQQVLANGITKIDVSGLEAGSYRLLLNDYGVQQAMSFVKE